MNQNEFPRIQELPSGLYLCAVPIGNLRDITLRVLDILASADVIAAEDTRTTRKLMELYGLDLNNRPLVAYHDHSSPQTRERLLRPLREGRSVAYVSEAGTPLIADPGYKLAVECRQAGLPVFAAPGASAVLTALAVSGLPSDAFHFAGFAPSSQGARRSFLEPLRDLQATLVLYESPKRLHELLGDLCDLFGTERDVVICRELTKKFEEVLRGPVQALRDELSDRTLKGEVVVLVDRNAGPTETEDDVREALKEALKTLRIKDAATAVAGASGRPRREIYQLALALQKEEEDR